MYEGIVLGYKVSPIAGVKMSWYSEISTIKEQEYFIDYQLKGPFKTWHHQHHFRKVANGTEVIDIIHYEVPFGFIGKLFHFLFVKNNIKQMFNYRQQKISELFSE